VLLLAKLERILCLLAWTRLIKRFLTLYPLVLEVMFYCIRDPLVLEATFYCIRARWMFKVKSP
jgi:hypothetical protein